MEGHTDAIYCLEVSGDGQYCISVGMDKTIRLWDLRMHKCSQSLSDSNYSEMNYVSLSENSRRFTLNSTINQSKKTASGNSYMGNSSKLAAVSHTDGLVTIW